MDGIPIDLQEGSCEIVIKDIIINKIYENQCDNCYIQ